MKHKILIILPNIPYPLSAGGNQAMFNGIYAIQEVADVFITYLKPFYKKDLIQQKNCSSRLNNVTFVPYSYNPFNGISKFFRWFFARLKRITKLDIKFFDYYCCQMSNVFRPQMDEYVKFLDTYVKQNSIDIVQMEMCECLSHVLTLPSHVKKIFVHHEIRYIINNQKININKKTRYRISKFEQSKENEIRLLNKCDSIITLSESDKIRLVNDGVSAPIYPSFAVVNTETTSRNLNECGNILTFVGPSVHIPNLIGIKWFLENCWDKLLQQDSSYRLKIIGYWAEDCCNEITQKYKNVDFLGFVSNLADALNNTIMIVPITVGSGIRMKILEAASLCIPFVSTTVGAEGLPFENGRDCLKGDSPEEFVDAVQKMRDKSLRVAFAKNANALVKEKYSMESLRKNRLEIYEKVMNGG